MLQTYVDRSKLSQVDIAALSGISKQHLGNCLTGVRAPTKASAEKLAKALQLTASERDEFITAAGIAKAMRKSDSADDVRELKRRVDLAEKALRSLLKFLDSRGVKPPQEIVKTLEAFLDS